jgi:hypothetical protein
MGAAGMDMEIRCAIVRPPYRRARLPVNRARLRSGTLHKARTLTALSSREGIFT